MCHTEIAPRKTHWETGAPQDWSLWSNGDCWQWKIRLISAKLREMPREVHDDQTHYYYSSTLSARSHVHVLLICFFNYVVVKKQKKNIMVACETHESRPTSADKSYRSFFNQTVRMNVGSVRFCKPLICWSFTVLVLYLWFGSRHNNNLGLGKDHVLVATKIADDVVLFTTDSWNVPTSSQNIWVWWPQRRWEIVQTSHQMHLFWSSYRRLRTPRLPLKKSSFGRNKDGKQLCRLPVLVVTKTSGIQTSCKNICITVKTWCVCKTILHLAGW